MNTPWLLLISPWESPTNEWEPVIGDSKEEIEGIIRDRDLTKDHFYLPVYELADILAQHFKES